VRETPQGQIIDLPKQHEVAIMVNTSRETVSRALHTLIRLNVLEKKGTVLIVRKPAQLKTAAENGLEELPAPKLLTNNETSTGKSAKPSVK
jgi:DNA-binding GntR family transcriptional regulator